MPLGIIITIKYIDDNVLLQFVGKTNAAEWIPSLLVEQRIVGKMFLADMQRGVSLVIETCDLPHFLAVMPDNMCPAVREIGLVEISGYSLRTDRKIIIDLYRVMEEAGIVIVGFSVSDTVLCLAIDPCARVHCLQILQEYFGESIE